jgi:MFS family permease
MEIPSKPNLFARWRLLPRNVWIVTITSFLTDISSEMILNLLPLYLSNVLGVKTNIIGVIEGVADTTASLVKIFSGWLSDRLSQRKWLTVAGYGLSTTAKPFLYWATSWGGVLMVRFTDRVGKGIRTAPRDALIADTVDDHQRGTAFGLHRAGDTAGAALGILIALGIVLVAQSGELELHRATFQTVIVISVLPAILAVLVLALGAQETAKITVHPTRMPLSLAGLDWRFRWFLLAVVAFTLGNSADAFLVLRAQERGVSVVDVLGILFTFNLVYALVSGPAGALSDHIGRRALLIGSWLLYALLYLGFALVVDAWQIWLFYALYGVYYGVSEGTAKALVADLVKPDQRGLAYGLYSAAVGIMALPASIAAGLLWQGALGWSGFGASAPFLFGAAMALLGVAIFVWAGMRQPARPFMFRS